MDNASEKALSEDAIPGEIWTDLTNTNGEPRLILIEDYEEDVLESYDQYAYDKNGLLVYKGHFHEDGELYSIIHYEYDDAGGLIRESEILSTGKVSFTLSYENDDQGNQIRKYSIPRVAENSQTGTSWIA